MDVRSLAVAAIVCAYVCPAYAEPTEEDIKKASKLFDEAEKKFKIGEYQLALADYKASYLLTGEPALLFNIGQCHRFLGNDQEAIKSYKIFLRDANPEGNSRAVAEKLLAELEAKGPGEQKATLSASAPLGAEGAIFFLDGAAMGPLPISTTITPGKHNVELRKDNLILYAETVEVKAGELRSLSISVAKEPVKEPLTQPVEPPKVGGEITLRFETKLKREYAVSLRTSTGVIACPAPVTSVNPCELKTASTGQASVQTDALNQSLTLPAESSVFTVGAPRPPKLGAAIFVAGASVALLGVVLSATSPFPENLPPDFPPDLDASGFPGARRFFFGRSMAVVTGVVAVGGGALYLVRKSASKKYVASHQGFVPVPR